MRGAFTHAPSGCQREQQNTWEDAADEQILHRDLRHDRVENQRQRRREQQAERARRREQPHRELLAIAVLDECRQQQAAEGEDGDSGSASEDREERREHRADDRRPARKPPEQCPEHVQQPLRGFPLGKQESAERKQRDRCQRGLHGQLVGFDEDRRRPDAVSEKQDDRQPSEHDEDRSSAAGRDEKRGDERPVKARRKDRGRIPHQPSTGDHAARRDRP